MSPIDIKDLSECLEIYDKCFSAYMKSEERDFRASLFLFLLRHKVISKPQVYALAPNENARKIFLRVQSYVQKGYVERIKNGDLSAYLLTASGRRMSIELFNDTFTLCSASLEEVRRPFRISYGVFDFEYEYVAAVVDNFISPGGVDRVLHHNTASKDMYIHLLFSRGDFVHQSECFFSAGRLVTLEEKKLLPLSDRTQRGGLRSDAVYSLSPLLSSDHLLIEQDTGNERIGTTLKSKIAAYTDSVFTDKLTYPGIIDCTLVFMVSHPAKIQTTKINSSDAKGLHDLKLISFGVERALGREPHSLTLGELSALLSGAPDGEAGRAGSTLSRLLTLNETAAETLVSDAEQLFPDTSGTLTASDDTRRRANIFNFLQKEEFNYLNRSYERGLSLCVLSNSFTGEIDALKLSLGDLGDEILLYHFREKVGYTYEPYHEFEIMVGVERRKVVFRNVYRTDEGEYVVIENCSMDLGGMYRAKLFMNGKCNNMTLICISSRTEGMLIYDSLQEIKNGSGTDCRAFFATYDPKTLRVQDVTVEI